MRGSKIVRYRYDKNNEYGHQAFQDAKIDSGEWPPPDVHFDDELNGGTGWWVGISELDENMGIFSPDYPDGEYNKPQFTGTTFNDFCGIVTGGEEPVDPTGGESEFQYNHNPEHGKGIYLLGEMVPFEFDEETKFYIHFDVSGSMGSSGGSGSGAYTSLTWMKDHVIKNTLINYYIADNPQWSSENTYDLGDKVVHNNIPYESTINNNNTEPGINDDWDNIYEKMVGIYDAFCNPVNQYVRGEATFWHEDDNCSHRKGGIWVEDENKYVVAVYQDEAEPVYHSYDLNSHHTTAQINTVNTHLSNFRNFLSNRSNDYIGIVMSIESNFTPRTTIFQTFIDKIINTGDEPWNGNANTTGNPGSGDNYNLVDYKDGGLIGAVTNLTYHHQTGGVNPTGGTYYYKELMKKFKEMNVNVVSGKVTFEYSGSDPEIKLWYYDGTTYHEMDSATGNDGTAVINDEYNIGVGEYYYNVDGDESYIPITLTTSNQTIIL